MVNDKVFKALSDTNRRRIIRMLQKEAMYPSIIAEKLEVSKPTVSEHLRILREAELVESERNGTSILYFLNASVLEEVIFYIMDLIQKEKK